MAELRLTFTKESGGHRLLAEPPIEDLEGLVLAERPSLDELDAAMAEGQGGYGLRVDANGSLELTARDDSVPLLEQWALALAETAPRGIAGRPTRPDSDPATAASPFARRTVSTRLSIAVKSLEDMIARIREMEDSPETRTLHAEVLACVIEVENWAVEVPTEPRRAALVRRVLELHLQVLARGRRA